MLDFPSFSLEPLYADENYYYGGTLWSRDGQMFVFTQTSGYCPTVSSSLWLHRIDGPESTKITEDVVIEYDCSEQPRPFHYISARAWSSNHQVIAVNVLTKAEVDSFDGPRLVVRRKPHVLQIQTGELIPVYPEEALRAIGLDTPYVRDYLTWQSFAPNGDRVLLTTSPEASLERSDTDDEYRVMLVGKLSDLSAIVQIKPPPGVNPVFSISSNTTCWSPDGDMLFLYERTDDNSRLWRVHIDTNEWKMISAIATRDGEPALSDDALRCSPDGRWIAWRSGVVVAEGKREFSITFVDTSNWDLNQKLVTVEERSGFLSGWMEDDEGHSYLALWDPSPGAGLFLLDPRGELDDQLILEYDALAEQLPTSDYRIYVGPWQP
jgi:hypothetical protein